MTADAWVITDGKVGTEKPCRAIVSALGFRNPLLIHLKPKFPWKFLPASLWPTSIFTVDCPELKSLAPPKIIVAASRLAVKPALALKKRFGAKTKVVFWQDPRTSYGKFDLIIAPKHDQLEGQNVVSTLVAPSLITHESIVSAAATYSVPGNLKGPYIAVLIGGPNKYYNYTVSLGEALGYQLKEVAAKNKASLLITASRRTPTTFMSKVTEILGEKPYYLWDGTGENPYDAFLGLAKWIVVTQDSISMVSDAIAAHKPVYVIKLKASKKSKFDVFYQTLIEQKHVKFFNGDFKEGWKPKNLDVQASLAPLKNMPK